MCTGTALRASLWFGALVCCSTLRADSVDVTLSAANKAFRAGEYRTAHSRLNQLSAVADRLPPGQQIEYWDLLADVDRDSGLLAGAERAAQRHLDLLNRAAKITGTQQAQGRQSALVRLALIKRDLSGARRPGDSSVEPAARLLDEARDLLAAALAMRAKSTQQDPLWEAETRLEYARTIALLDDSDEARREYASASSAATAAIRRLGDLSNAAEQCVRGLSVVRQSYLGRDAAMDA